MEIHLLSFFFVISLSYYNMGYVHSLFLRWRCFLLPNNLFWFQAKLWLHFMCRSAVTVVVPTCIYLGVFYVHLNTLTKAGPHDNIMTSAFQASLEVCSDLKYTFQYYIFANMCIIKNETLVSKLKYVYWCSVE